MREVLPVGGCATVVHKSRILKRKQSNSLHTNRISTSNAWGGVMKDEINIFSTGKQQGDDNDIIPNS